MPTKKDTTLFNKQVDSIVKEAGATETGKDHYKYVIATKAGDLLVNVWEPEKCHSFAIFCKFNDPIKAIAILPNAMNLNRYSGKWNFHGEDSADLLKLFSISLKGLL